MSISCSNRDPAGPVGAIRTLRDIHIAENVYKERIGKYGTLQELETISSSPYVGRAATEEPFGFRFVLQVSENGYRVAAYPVTELTTRSFFMDETGAIRHSTGTRRADASSPLLD